MSIPIEKDCDSVKGSHEELETAYSALAKRGILNNEVEFRHK